MKIILMPDLQEVSDMPMDIGSSQAELEAQFGDALDYSRLHEGWQKPNGKHATDTESLLKRGERIRHYLKNREEKNIVAVFHGSFVHYVTGNVKDGEKVGQ
jgi:broad specificity phosphatase PhoE